jgi:hypothetical protein
VRRWLLLLYSLGSESASGNGQWFDHFGFKSTASKQWSLQNRIIEERRIKSLLARGCGNKAIGEITNNENLDLKTLSGFVDSNLDEPTVEYINNLDPTLLDELKTFDGKFVNTWSGTECN